MRKMTSGSIVFNLAGVSVLALVAGYMVRTALVTEHTAQCSRRYPAGMQFALDAQDGTPLSMIELQARAGLREWGVLENAKIVLASDSPSGKSLDISLAKITNENSQTQNGLGFVWPVYDLGSAKSACLSYSVYLPENFKFGESGHLPGLTGTGTVTSVEGESSDGTFTAHVGWGQHGEIGIDVRSPYTGGSWFASKRQAEWPRGHWVQVDQEVVMNTPGRANGILRMWIDGALRVENTSFRVRASDEVKMGGVVADTGFIQSANDEVVVRLSPFVVQWQ